jgi:hypothetical protein
VSTRIDWPEPNEKKERAMGKTIEQGSFVELRGRPWLVEELRGGESDLQAANAFS